MPTVTETKREVNAKIMSISQKHGGEGYSQKIKYLDSELEKEKMGKKRHTLMGWLVSEKQMTMRVFKKMKMEIKKHSKK